MNERNNIVASAMRHKGITLLLAAVMMLAGIVSLIYIPKDEFPQFNLPIGLVVGVYPGATEEEVEQQLAKPLEDFLWTFKEIDKSRVSTVCQNNVCYSIVWLNVSPDESTEFWNKLKERLPLLRAQLPAGVLGVLANEDFGDVSAMLISIESEDKTYREMDNYARALGDRLRTIPELANIYTLGGQNEQISVYLDRDRLATYGLNTAIVYSKLSSQSGNLITGSLDDGKLSRMLHIVPSLNSEQDLAQTIVYSDPSGTIVRLGDIADIKRECPPAKRYIENNGHKSMIMSLQMVGGNNIVSFGKDVKSVLKDFQDTLPPDVHINVITDQSEVVDDSVKEFLTELLIAIASVIVITMLMLPMRVAGVAVTTIPITIFISIAIFYMTGVQINSVTLAALIVSLGMIVDDSIVVVDCYIDRLDEGMPRWKAAITSARQFTASIITATLSISIVFFPFLFTTDNIIHDFIESFPYAITIVLTVSLLVALLVVPIIEHRFITHGFGSEHHLILERIQAVYDRIIGICFRHKKATLAIGFFTIFLGALLMLACMTPLLHAVGTSENTFDFSRSYLTWIALGGPAIVTATLLTNLIRGEGSAKSSMVGMMAGTITNIILDPVFILKSFWGIPGLGMGVAGAAIATVLGNIVSIIVYFVHIISKKSVLSIHFKYFSIHDGILRQVLSIGLPASSVSVLMSLSNILMNNMLVTYGDIPVASMGIAMKANMLAIFVQMGFAMGIQPLIGFNFGAKNYRRMKDVMKFTAVCVFISGTILTIIYFIYYLLSVYYLFSSLSFVHGQ